MPTRNCYPVLIVWAATARAGKSRSYTSNIVPARLAESVWCKKKLQSSLYFLLSGFEPSLLHIYFSDSLNGCSHCTKVWHKNLSVMRRSIFEIGDAHLHSGTEISPKSTNLARFSWRHKSYPVLYEHSRDGYKNRQKAISFKRNNNPARASSFFVLLCLPFGK